jgi:hypothetical protein
MVADVASLIWATSLFLVQAAEGIDQDQNRNWHAEQPQQEITSHTSSSLLMRIKCMGHAGGSEP